MGWRDLTHILTPGMPVFPGDPAYEQTPVFRLERDGFRETFLGLNSHTGTHMDAPAHLLAQGETLDRMPLERFFGRACVLDCGGCGTAIPRSLLERVEGEGPLDFLILSTGWEERWRRESYQTGFPVLTQQGADYLVSLGLKGVGVDALSVDPAESAELPIHRTLLSGGLVLVENLRGLIPLRGTQVWFGAFPLAFVQADGAPVRAVAYVDEMVGGNRVSAPSP